MIFLNHMPASTNKRFQLGVGGNNHNCENGFGGWFGWTGKFNGQDASGLSGDVIADVEPSGTIDDCGGAMTTATYGAFNIDAQTAVVVTVETEVNDTQAPTFAYVPASIEFEYSDTTICADAGESSIIDWLNATDSADVCLTTDDNCGVWNPVYYNGDSIAACDTGGTCGTVVYSVDTVLNDCSIIGLQRRWTATDDYGNNTTVTQLLTIQDTQGPIIAADSMVTIDACNINTWMATASDCGSGVASFTFTQDFASGTCDTTSINLVRTYTAIDGCGNESTFEQFIALVDTIAPTMLGQEQFLDCGSYDPDAYYPLLVTDCSLKDWTEGPLDQDDWFAPNNGSILYSDLDGVGIGAVGSGADIEVSWSDALPVHLAGDTCYRVTRTVQISDRCGNEASYDYELNVYDNTAPGLSAASILNIECSDYWRQQHRSTIRGHRRRQRPWFLHRSACGHLGRSDRVPSGRRLHFRLPLHRRRRPSDCDLG